MHEKYFSNSQKKFKFNYAEKFAISKKGTKRHEVLVYKNICIFDIYIE